MTQEMASSRAESDVGATTTGESGDLPDVPPPPQPEQQQQPPEPPAPPKAAPSADADPAESQQEGAAEEAAAGAGDGPHASSEQEAGGASDGRPQAEAELPGLDGLDIMNEMRGMLEKLDSLKQDCDAAAPEPEAEAAEPQSEAQAVQPQSDAQAAQPESETPGAEAEQPHGNAPEGEPQTEATAEAAPQKPEPSPSPQEQPQADAAAGGADLQAAEPPFEVQAQQPSMVIRYELLGFINQALNNTYSISNIRVGNLQTYWSPAQDYFMYYQAQISKWQISPRMGPGEQPGGPDLDLLQDALAGGQRGLAMQVEDGGTGWREWVEGAWHLVDLQIGCDMGDGNFQYTAKPPAPIRADLGAADAAAGTAPGTPASRLPSTPQVSGGAAAVQQRIPQTPRERLLNKAGLVAAAPSTPMAARTGAAAPSTPMAARRMPQTPTGAGPAWGAAAAAAAPAEAPSPEPAAPQHPASVAAKLLAMPERFLPDHLKAPVPKRRKVNEEPTLFNFGKAVNKFTIWVGFFPDGTTLEELKRVFSGCGPIYDKDIRGVQALLHFSSAEDRQAALDLGVVAVGGFQAEVRGQEHFEEVPEPEPAVQEQDQDMGDAGAQAQAQETPQAEDQEASGKGGWQGEGNQDWSSQQGGNWKQQHGDSWGGAAAGSWGGQSQANDQGTWVQAAAKDQGGWAQSEVKDQGSWGQSQTKDQGSWGQSQTKDQGSWGQSQAKEQGSWGGNSWGNSWGAKSEGAAGGGWSEDPAETLEVPRDMGGRIIGKGGSTIKMLQDSSGAKIKLSKPDDESQPCVVSISGKPSCVAEGIRLVQEIIAKGAEKGKGKGKEPGSSETMEIPKDSVRTLIGKGGETIQRLQAESGARLQVSKPQKWDKWPPTVTMSGTPEAVAAARALVQETLGEQLSAGAGGGGWSAPAAGGGWSAPAGGSWSTAAADQGAGAGGAELRAGGAAEAKPAKGKGKGLPTDSMAIPPEKASAVAGAGGEGIKRLQLQTGARVTLENGDADQGQPCRVCFSGSLESISRAKALVRTIVGVQAQPRVPMGTGGPAFPKPVGAVSAFGFSQKLKSGTTAGAIDVSAALPPDAEFEKLCKQMAEHPPEQDEFDKLCETVAAEESAAPRAAGRVAPGGAAARPSAADDEFEKLCAEEAAEGAPASQVNPPEQEGGGAAGLSKAKGKAKAKGKSRAKAKGKAAEDKAAEAETRGADGDAAAGAAAPAKRRGRAAKASEGAPPEKQSRQSE